MNTSAQVFVSYLTSLKFTVLILDMIIPPCCVVITCIPKEADACKMPNRITDT